MALEAQREAEAQRLTGTVLREDLRGLRMVPAALVLEPLRRAVRDVAGRVGKEVELTVEGGEVRLDRQIVDALRDPLLHLVRNAVDHGIELPAARREAGKPTAGRIAVRVEPRGRAWPSSSRTTGRGSTSGRSAPPRCARGSSRPTRWIASPTPRRPGSSSTPGSPPRARSPRSRGEGSAWTWSSRRSRGSRAAIDVRWEAGRGTRFDLGVPLALSASAALVVRLGRDLVAVSADPIEHVVLLRDQDVGTVAGRTTILVEGEHLPYVPLARLLRSEEGGGPARQAVALVLAHGGERVAVGVEELVGQQELVMSSLGALAAQIGHLAGAAVLDDGRVVGVLSAAELVRRAQPGATSARAREGGRRVLVADDSLTTRSAMKALLELSGYAVVPAADGEEALQLLRGLGADLVVSDVQMPRLDGFGLTRAVKADPAPAPHAGDPRHLPRRPGGPRRRPGGRRRRLPREARGRARQAARPRAPAPAPRMIRCLLVDDSRSFRALLRTLLERAGIDVVGEAADGDAAVRQVVALRPDVVTMDVRMPGKDGLAAIEEIMRVAPTPVVVVSAEAGPERQELAFWALELGALEVLAKPRAVDAARFDREVRGHPRSRSARWPG